MRALTGGAAKELIPVAGVPALEWVARECAESGIDEVLIVISPGKHDIEEHVRDLGGAPGMPRAFRVAVQQEPRGLADAIRIGRDFAGDDPLAVALPDNIFIGDRPGLAQVIDAFRAHEMSAVAMVEIDAAEASRRGATPVYSGRLDGDDYHITHIPSKGAKSATFDPGSAGVAFTGVGRYAFTPELWPVIDEVERTLQPGAELDDLPVMQTLLARGRLIGRRIRGRFLDVGLPAGYEEANAILAGTRGAGSELRAHR